MPRAIPIKARRPRRPQAGGCNQADRLHSNRPARQPCASPRREDAPQRQHHGQAAGTTDHARRFLGRQRGDQRIGIEREAHRRFRRFAQNRIGNRHAPPRPEPHRQRSENRTSSDTQPVPLGRIQRQAHTGRQTRQSGARPRCAFVQHLAQSQSFKTGNSRIQRPGGVDQWQIGRATFGNQRARILGIQFTPDGIQLRRRQRPGTSGQCVDQTRHGEIHRNPGRARSLGKASMATATTSPAAAMLRVADQFGTDLANAHAWGQGHRP